MTVLHIDTDMGVDDALALVLATRLPGVRVAALSTVFGNVPLEQATRNAVILRALLPGAGFAVWAGAEQSLDAFHADAARVHGDDGLGGGTATLDPLWLARLAEMPAPAPLRALQPDPAPGRVVILGLGPATNIPALLQAYGPDRIERVVLMAGAVFDTGNVTPHAEFNAYCDPHALNAVVRSGLPATLVPLDLCRKVLLPRQVLDAWRDAAPGPLTELLVAAHRHYMDGYRQWEGIDGCFPHDSLALLVAARPGSFFRLRGRLAVGTAGEARGQTMFSPDPNGRVEVAMGGALRWVRELLRDWPRRPATEAPG